MSNRNWLKSMRIASKLTLISLSFALPIAVLLYFMIAGINHDIRFAELELLGNEYHRPLIGLMDHLPRHQVLVNRREGGESTADYQLSAQKADIDKELETLTAVDATTGIDLQFTDEGLGKRQREKARPHELVQNWKRLNDGLGSMTVQDSNRHHRELIDTVRTMITHAGDTSNLILDPDLDSYYLMDITLLALPQTQDRLAQIMAFGEDKLPAGNLDPQSRQQLAVFASLLSEVDFDRVVASSRFSLNEDANFYGTSASLQANLPPVLDRYIVDTEAFQQLLLKAAEAETESVTIDEFRRAGDAARVASFDLWNVAVQELDSLLQTRISDYQGRRQQALIYIALALTLALVLVYVVARSITQPINVCVESLQHLAAKDLTGDLQLDSGGEMGDIAAAVDQAAGGMREAIESIRSNAAALSTAARDQIAASQQMSTDAELTSSQASRAAQAAEQVNGNVQTVAQAAESIAASIREVAEQANEAAGVATDGVRIAETTNSSVAQLGKSSEDIGNVLKTITSIAEQTNLLALNATIEASRAGEVGKGFGVVANEVKELSRETAAAADEIREKIATIRRDTEAAVGAISRIGEIINQINATQTLIAQTVEKQTENTRQIGLNANEAARGTAEIARNISGVAEAAGNTSQGTQQTTSSARDLSRMAADLTALVGQFRCQNGQPNGEATAQPATTD